MINLSVIVAVFNAKKTLRSVVDVVKKLKEAKDILVIDDWSTDGSQDEIRSIPGIRTIFHDNNYGKGRVIVDGLIEAKHDIVLLVDSDLRTLRVEHLQNLVDTFVNSGSDMVIAARERYSPFDWLSGERIFIRTTVVPWFSLMKTSGFGVEQIINYAHRKKKVKIIYSLGIGHPLKYTQYSCIRATKLYAIENWHMFKFFLWTFFH
jgi:glycosyltransferase involved in cell wall biosynthesis